LNHSKGLKNSRKILKFFRIDKHPKIWHHN